MNISRPLTVDEASRLAVTATAADLEDWALSVAVTAGSASTNWSTSSTCCAPSAPRSTLTPTVFPALAAS